MEPLFKTTKIAFTKLAVETVLPEDQSTWSQEILQAAIKTAPYLADFEINVNLDRVDAERGYAFGHIEVSNKSEMAEPSAQDREALGIRSARIPVLVREKKLQPLDLLVDEKSEIGPLTKRRLREALFRPQMFDVTSKTPGDMSMVGQLFPPYRQNFGFGGSGFGFTAGIGKEGSALEDFLLKAASEENLSQNLEQSYADAPQPAKPVPTVLQSPGVSDSHLAQRLSKALGVPESQVQSHLSRKKNTTKKLAAVANANLFNNFTGGIKRVVRGRVKKGSMFGDVVAGAYKRDIQKLAMRMNEADVGPLFLSKADLIGPILESMKLAMEYKENDRLMLDAIELPPTVAQIRKVAADHYVIKTANHALWDPKEETEDRAGVIRRFGEKVALETDVHGAVTLSEPGVSERNPELSPQIISNFGLYRVQDSEGNFLVGHVFTNLIDITGDHTPISLFSNGSDVALQADIVGEPIGKSNALTFGKPSGVGMFVRSLPNGSVEATVPFEIKGRVNQLGEKKLAVQTLDGETGFVALQPNIKGPAAHDRTLLLPDTFQWLSLGAADSVALVSDPASYNAVKEAQNKLATVVVRATPDMSSFSFDGAPMGGIPKMRRHQMTLDDASFYLGGMGTNMKYAMKKIAHAAMNGKPAEIRVGHYLKTAEDRKESALQKQASKGEDPFLKLRQDLVKEAAILEDPNSMDVVLSLGLLTQDNIATFLEYLPNLEKAVSDMCRLLLAARLGLKDLPEGALEKLVRCSEEVVEGLRSIAFQQT